VLGWTSFSSNSNSFPFRQRSADLDGGRAVLRHSTTAEIAEAFAIQAIRAGATPISFNRSHASSR
jgi:hypothetical protein